MTSSLRKLVIIKSDKKYSKKEIHEIYELVATWVEIGNEAKSMLAIYEITEKSYSNWIKKGKPPFNRKFNPKHIEVVKEFCSKKGNDIGLKKTQIKINKELNLKLSIPLIQFAKSLINLPKKQNYERRKKPKGSHNRYVKPDLIMGDYSSNNYLEKIGFDGTFLNKLIIGGVITKMLFLPAYDFYSGEVCTWSLSKTETSVATVKMLEKLVDKIKKFKIKKTIVHSDQGTAFTSKLFSDFCKSNNLTNSMSWSGFEKNQYVEQRHRWLKKDFYSLFGHEFSTVEALEFSLWKFVKIINEKNIFLKSQLSANETIRNWRR